MACPAALVIVGEDVVRQMENSAWFVLALMCLPAPMVLIEIFCTYQGVVNAMRALLEKPIRYALSIPFVK
jgi:hypothetical protein